MQSRYNMSSYYNGGVPMIDKQYTPIDWSKYNFETATYLGNSKNYTEFELNSEEKTASKKNAKSVTVNRIIQLADL